jgi:hypothetical protein
LLVWAKLLDCQSLSQFHSQKQSQWSAFSLNNLSDNSFANTIWRNPLLRFRIEKSENITKSWFSKLNLKEQYRQSASHLQTRKGVIE